MKIIRIIFSFISFVIFTSRVLEVVDFYAASAASASKIFYQQLSHPLNWQRSTTSNFLFTSGKETCYFASFGHSATPLWSTPHHLLVWQSLPCQLTPISLKIYISKAIFNQLKKYKSWGSKFYFLIFPHLCSPMDDPMLLLHFFLDELVQFNTYDKVSIEVLEFFSFFFPFFFIIFISG